MIMKDLHLRGNYRALTIPNTGRFKAAEDRWRPTTNKTKHLEAALSPPPPRLPLLPPSTSDLSILSD